MNVAQLKTEAIITLSDGQEFKITENKGGLEITGWSFPNKMVIEPMVGNKILIKNK